MLLAMLPSPQVRFGLDMCITFRLFYLLWFLKRCAVATYLQSPIDGASWSPGANFHPCTLLHYFTILAPREQVMF